MAPSQKSVLITGCSTGGIGEGLAEVFLDKDYHVFATVRNPSRISQSLSSSVNVTVLILDVLSSESIASAAERVEKETSGKLDVLVNNSGGNYILPGLDVSIEEAKKLFDLNFWAPLKVLQAFAPLLIKARGCLVNNSSAAAYLNMGFMSIHNGSKAALISASESWRHELQPLGVRTITLVTCGVRTKFFDKYQGEEVPETSHYAQISDFIHGLSDGRLQSNSCTTRQYAIKVVGEIEKGTVGIVWAGKDAFAGRVAASLSPRWVFDKISESIVPIAREMADASKR